jgi:AraC-like DNA-binding protein
VTEVAAEAGWNSLGHFHSVFRRRLGLTPSAFRACAEPLEEAS